MIYGSFLAPKYQRRRTERREYSQRIYQHLCHKQDVMVIIILFSLSGALITQADQSE